MGRPETRDTRHETRDTRHETRDTASSSDAPSPPPPALAPLGHPPTSRLQRAPHPRRRAHDWPRPLPPRSGHPASSSRLGLPSRPLPPSLRSGTLPHFVVEGRTKNKECGQPDARGLLGGRQFEADDGSATLGRFNEDLAAVGFYNLFDDR